MSPSPRPPRRRRTLAPVAAGALALLAPLARAQEAQPAAPVAQAEAAPVRMTLSEALARAEKVGPDVVQAQGAVRTAKAAQLSALGAYLPSVSANAGSTLNSRGRVLPETGVVAGSSTTYSAGLSASWDVFTGGRRPAAQAKARADEQAARAQLLQQTYGLAFTVESTFYDALRAQELASVARAREERAQKGLEAAQKRLQVGSATRSDVLRAQLELTTAREALLDAQNQQRTAAFALGRLVGADDAVEAQADATSQPRPLAEEESALVESLVSEAPAVKAAEASLASASASTRSARAQYLPSVRLSGGYDWVNNSDLPIQGDWRSSWSMRLGLSFPLFDGFAREESVERARVQETTSSARLADAKRAARADAQRLLGALKLAGQRITLSEESVKAAEEDLRVQQERYQLGASTMLDLLTSQENLVQEQTDLVSARFDFQLARAELQALAGRPL